MFKMFGDTAVNATLVVRVVRAGTDSLTKIVFGDGTTLQVQKSVSDVVAILNAP